MSQKILSRGALIVLEGCDRAGKSTQCKTLVKSLEAKGHKAQYVNFPNRTTDIGEMINSYLTKKVEMADEVIHLLFSANRWEAMNKMEQLLRDGITLIVDRYSYSGVAFSTAKGLDFNWCKNVEQGLLKPDLVLMLNMTAEAISQRGGFGEERYEVTEFQQEAMKVFERLIDHSYWKLIDADKPFNDLHSELLKHAEETIKSCRLMEMQRLW